MAPRGPLERPRGEGRVPGRPPGPAEPSGRVGVVAKRKLLKPMAILGVLGTMASVWWFALKPRRKHEQ